MKSFKYRILFLFLVTLPGFLHAQVNWKYQGGPYGGKIKAITQTSTGRLYLGSLGGGLYYSDDDGANWTWTLLLGSGF